MILMLTSKKNIIIYTDGACIGNPGLGGWGAIIINQDNEKKISGGSQLTTNNRMEMQAVVEALKFIKTASSITLYTDSKYIINGISSWIYKWKKNNWTSSNKKPIKNIDLWIIIDSFTSKHTIEWKWIKGHSGDYYNEEVDKLARAEAEKFR
tara:strand:+ start:759 stop:1214 length:456 start_codon:yes stop_codon:yes gene_type:complete